MIVLFREFIASGNDVIDNKNSSIPIGKKCVVFAIRYKAEKGFDVFIQPNEAQPPDFFSVLGFEFLSKKFPDSWVMTVGGDKGKEKVMMIPNSWNYDTFFEDLKNEKLEAVDLFKQEIKDIFAEETYTVDENNVNFFSEKN